MLKWSAFATATLLSLIPALAQSPDAFFRGKTLTWTVGYPPSGGFDAYSRAAARFFGKNIPGNPNVIVSNMPGASSLQFVRWLANVAPKDGTAFGMFNRGLMPKSVLEPNETRVDFTKFGWIGSMNSEYAVCYTWGGKKIASLDDLKRTRITLGDTSKNSGGYIYTSMLRWLAPENARVVLGYATTGDIWLAIERGEIDGNCTLVSSLQTQRPDWLAQKKVDVLVQFAPTRQPGFESVPTIFELIKDENETQAVHFLIASEAIGRPVIAPPGVPTDRLAALRKAFLDTMKDPEFLDYARKAQMDIDPVAGEAAQKIADDIQKTPAAAVEVARKLMD